MEFGELFRRRNLCCARLSRVVKEWENSMITKKGKVLRREILHAYLVNENLVKNELE